jgi:hypothetical protein
MIYYPYQFMKFNLHEIEIIRYLSLYDSLMTNEEKQYYLLFGQVVLEQYLGYELNY